MPLLVPNRELIGSVLHVRFAPPLGMGQPIRRRIFSILTSRVLFVRISFRGRLTLATAILPVTAFVAIPPIMTWQVIRLFVRYLHPLVAPLTLSRGSPGYILVTLPSDLRLFALGPTRPLVAVAITPLYLRLPELVDVRYPKWTATALLHPRDGYLVPYLPLFRLASA